MFRTIAIMRSEADPKVTWLDLKPAEFFSLHVKRLCITYGAVTMAQATQILSTCTSIFDLAFWIEWPSDHGSGDSGSSTPLAHEKLSMARVLSQLPALRRLELPYEHLVEIERAGNLPCWSSTLTHFEVVFWNFSSKEGRISVPLLRDLVSLTHLCIIWQEYDLEVHEKGDVASILESRPSLQVVLVDVEEEIIPDDHVPVDVRIVYRTEGDDPVVEWRDQEPMAGKWAVAEEVIARRRRWYEAIEGVGKSRR
jgi:hypothetical protein